MSKGLAILFGYALGVLSLGFLVALLSVWVLVIFLILACGSGFALTREIAESSGSAPFSEHSIPAIIAALIGIGGMFGFALGPHAFSWITFGSGMEFGFAALWGLSLPISYFSGVGAAFFFRSKKKIGLDPFAIPEAPPPAD